MNNENVPTCGRPCKKWIIFLVALSIFLTGFGIAQTMKLGLQSVGHGLDIMHACGLVDQFARHYERNGAWPEPGVIDEDSAGMFVGSQKTDRGREDFYRLSADQMVKILLMNDGRTWVTVVDAKTRKAVWKTHLAKVRAGKDEK